MTPNALSRGASEIRTREALLTLTRFPGGKKMGDNHVVIKGLRN